MNSVRSERVLNPVHQDLVIDDSGQQDSADSGSRGGVTILLSLLGWVFLGTTLFFILFALSGRMFSSPLGTLFSASFSGFVGILVSALCLRNLNGFRVFLVAILVAYILRIFVGIAVYQNVFDEDYFEGQGHYKNNYWEYYWTYESMIRVCDWVQNKGEWRTDKIFSEVVNKNAYIHTYMGYFLVAGNSRHAMDIAPFNAYHHTIVGILVAGLALALGYRGKIALWSGALIAWTPWGFASSIMWRDSVGVAWVVLAIVLLCLGKNFGFIGIFLFLIPAGFLVWAHRTPYLLAIVVIAALSILHDQQKGISSVSVKVLRLIVMTMIFGVVIFFLQNHITQIAMKGHEKISANFIANFAFKIAVLPFQLLRALAGPFPWRVTWEMDYYHLFDCFYHPFQFGIFLIIVKNWRRILGQTNILSYSAAIFWVSAFISGAAHTAYLAVAAPFILPAALDTGEHLWKYFLISISAFLLANVFYRSLGLAGSGWILGITGY